MTIITSNPDRTALLVTIGLLSVLAHGIAWSVLAWVFSLSAAGYLDSLGRVPSRVAYYHLLQNGLQAPTLLGLAYGVVSYLMLLPSLKTAITDRLDLSSFNISWGETRRFLKTGCLAIAIWVTFALIYAKQNAPDLWGKAVILGALAGGLADVGGLWSLYLVRVPRTRLWREAVILLACALGCWASIFAVLRLVAG